MSNKSPDTFGSRVYLARLAAGLTQEQLAARVGLSRTMITQIETERSMTTLAGLTRLCRALCSSADTLLGLSPFPAPIMETASLRLRVAALRREIYGATERLRALADEGDPFSDPPAADRDWDPCGE